MNTFAVTGRLSKDVQASLTKGGCPVVKFDLAENAYDGTKKEQKTNFYNVEAYKTVAERAAKFLKKGDLISIVGRIDIVTYEKDGKHYKYYKVIMNDFSFLSGKKQEPETPTEAFPEPEPHKTKVVIVKR